MSTSDIANRLVALCREGKFLEAVDTLYADNVQSVEAREFAGMPRELSGKAAVRGKNVWWFENNDLHNVTITGPFSSPERFALVFTFDRTTKATGERGQFTEVAVYTVEDGKIVREEFLYAAPASN